MTGTRAVIAAVILLFTANSAVAGGHRGGLESAGDMRGLGKVAEQLDLSETQKQDFAALLELYRPRFAELVQRGKADRERLLEMAPDDPAYPAMAETVGNEAAASARESVTLLAELQGLVYGLLSAEQQQSYLDLRAKQRAKMAELRKRGKDGYKDGHTGKQGKHHKCGKCAHTDDGDNHDYCPHRGDDHS